MAEQAPTPAEATDPQTANAPLRSWPVQAAAAGATVFALVLYVSTLAPGITWAHQGADSGELLAAAVTNGVPHPPGYPLYMLLLQTWMLITGSLLPDSDLAWRGNLLSALCAALSVGVTVFVLAKVLAHDDRSWLWALLAALAWAVSPLLWTQAVITEVYALHALFVTLLGWALICRDGRPVWLIPVLALGFSHHLTFVLLMPATAYYLWRLYDGSPAARLGRIVAVLAIGALIGALFHVRTPVVAAALPPPPINWGYADNGAGFWWLVSGSAYRSYLFNLPATDIIGRVATWAYTITTQYTPVGLAIALIGYAYLDSSRPRLRDFALLWIVPISLYSMSYFTRDSEIYLLSVSWMLALWLGVGLYVIAEWLTARSTRLPWRAITAGIGGCAVVALTIFHFPSASLRSDAEATDYLLQVNEVIEPDSIIITTGDAKTIAVWYAAWGDGSLQQAAPNAVIVNYSLYQFDWYRRLLDNLYPNVPMVGVSADALIDANAAQRPIYLTETIPIIPERQLQEFGPLWRVRVSETE